MDNEEFNQVNLLTTKQNMDTPLITEEEDTDELVSQDNLEVDSDVNEDPKREALLDDSLESFLNAKE